MKEKRKSAQQQPSKSKKENPFDSFPFTLRLIARPEKENNSVKLGNDGNFSVPSSTKKTNNSIKLGNAVSGQLRPGL